MAGIQKQVSQPAGVAVTAPSAYSGGVNSVSSADYTILDTDGYDVILVSTSSSDRTVTLPTAANNGGRRIVIKKTDSGSGKVIVSGSVDGVSGRTLSSQYDCIVVMSDGSSWLTEVHCETWSGTITLSGGFSANPTGTAVITRIGRRVFMKVGNISGTSNATTNFSLTFSDTGSNIPTRFAPTTSQTFSGQLTCFDAGALTTGCTYTVGSSTIDFAKNLNGATASWTGSSTKGTYESELRWDIR